MPSGSTSWAGRPGALVEQRLEHRSEVLAALRAQLVREPLYGGGAPPRDLLWHHVIHARERLVGHTSAEREGEQLPLPRVKTPEGADELFRWDHAAAP